MPQARLTPREFLKSRRPERFSDSFVEQGSRLDRTVLEYHIHTLTSRSQEIEFQTFARHLLQREVCPNLLPQSGPTGGGDSKVDSETYPVSDDYSLVWFVGKGREAADERWAFAFSAKEDWRSKVQSDVKKIAETGRGYTKAIFVTNQYVSDKKRAELEDVLTSMHGMDVRIFDRTWILDRVFEGRHEDLAIDDLKLQCDARTIVRQGPLDARKEIELEALESRVLTATQEGRQNPQLAADCIEAVIISRSLDRPRTEVDGLLSRAERVSKQCGTAHQQLIAAYQHTWTAFWYYEDFGEFVRMYSTVEERAKGSDNVYHLELLCNTWYLLNIVAQGGSIDVATELDPHTEVLVAELNRFAAYGSRPSAALQARTMRLMVELLRTKLGESESIFEQLKEVIQTCECSIGFPLEPLVQVLTTIGSGFGNSNAFDELFNTLETVWARRQGDVAAARLLVGRGAQQLDAGRPLQAIKTLGRALTRLFKDESKDEMIHALYLCSSAYERVGLLWAARGAALTAASLATDEFWKYEDVTRFQANCYNRLKWIELQLGRIPQTLSWYEVDQMARSVLREKGVSTTILDDDDIAFDGILGIQFLRLELFDLKGLEKLPESLESMQLHASSLALRFALGDNEGVASDLQLDASTEEDLQSRFVKWRDQPAREELRFDPQLNESQKLRLKTAVAGCDVSVECQNSQECLAVGESLLAVMESLLATGLVDRVVASQPSLIVRIKTSEFSESPFSFKVTEHDGRHTVDIQCSVLNPNRLSVEEQRTVKERLLDMVVACICHCFFIGDPDSFIDRLFGDERAVERAVHFTSSFVVLGNVLGDCPRNSISDWMQSGAKAVPLSRNTTWDSDLRTETAPKQKMEQPSKRGTGSPPKDLPNPEAIKHSQLKSVSLIRNPLWNRAGWSGMATIVFDEPYHPPYLLPVFRDARAARAIFSGFREDVGATDEHDRLRVTLIRGINRENPFAYRIIFGSQLPNEIRESEWKMVVMASRVHTMEPTSSENIDRFLLRYSKVNTYIIAPCTTGPNGDIEKPIFELGIQKRQLIVRDSWKVGLNDLDSGGILPDDDPIIPDGEVDPPVNALLAWKRSKHAE